MCGDSNSDLNLRTFYVTELNSDKNLELGKLQPPRSGQQELAEWWQNRHWSHNHHKLFVDVRVSAECNNNDPVLAAGCWLVPTLVISFIISISNISNLLRLLSSRPHQSNQYLGLYTLKT